MTLLLFVLALSILNGIGSGVAQIIVVDRECRNANQMTTIDEKWNIVCQKASE